MKEDSTTLKEATNERYPAETITDVDYADDLALLANTFNLTESQMHSLLQTTRDVIVNFISDEIDMLCIQQGRIISNKLESFQNQIERI